MSLQDAVQQIVSAGPAAAADAGTATVLSTLREGASSVLTLVSLLKGPLTDEQDHETRARAVQLLSQVASDAPEALQAGDVGVMAEFLAAKLQDWRCVDAAVPGCLALLQRHQHPNLAPLPEAAALQLITRFLAVHVQGLVYKGRITCYQLLLEILQGPHAVAAVLGGNNFVDFTVVAMENEADPRCLLTALQCVQAVGKLYQRPELSSITHLDDGLEDLFDVGVVPYFPMMFTPPKNDTNNITRDELLERVVQAMAGCPQFAALGVPLLSEKLGSSLRQAKSDSLVALPVCLRGWGPAAVKPHLQAVWLMLKAELMGPATAEGITPDQLSNKHTAATAAAAALTQCITALGPNGSLDQQVLNDVAVEDLMQYLGLVNPPWSRKSDESAAGPEVTTAAAAVWDLPEKAQKRLVCIARFVAAVAAAGGSSCAAVCSNILKPAVAAVLDDTAAAQSGSSSSSALRPMQANCAVLCVLHSVLKAIAAAAAAAGADAYAAVADSMPSIAAAVIALQQQLQASSSNGDDPYDALQAEQLQIWILLLWQDLFSLQHQNAPLQQQHLDTAAQQLVQLALCDNSSSSSIKLDLDTDGSSSSAHSVAAAAVTALTKLAGWPAASTAAAAAAAGNAPAGMQAVKQHAAPVLLETFATSGSSSSSSSSSKEQQSRVLNVLQRIAGSSAAAAWEVMKWLQPLILEQLQNNNLVSICSMLTTLHSSALPALADDLEPQQSAAAAEFAASLLQGWQQQQRVVGDANALHNAQYHSCLLLAQLVAKCSSKDQQLLMLTACECVATAAAAVVDVMDAAAVSSPAALAAAVIAAARPGVLTASSIVDLARALAALCTANDSSSSSKLNKAVSGVAVASVIHKCIAHQRSNSSSTGDNATPDALMQAALPLLLQPMQAQLSAAMDNHDSLLGALQALAWVSRGLAMQRHDGWLQCMQQVLLLLPQLAPTAAAAKADAALQDTACQTELMWAAASLFSTLVTSPLPPAAADHKAVSPQQQVVAAQCSTSMTDTGLGLKLNLHWTARPLWQQKAFTQALEAVSAAVSSGSSDPAAAAAGQQQWQQWQQSTLGLHLAAASLISAAPAAVSSAARPQVVPLLLQSLVTLADTAPSMLIAAAAASSPATAALTAAGSMLKLLHDCLLLVADWVMAAADKVVQDLLTPHVDLLVTVLCQLARLTLPSSPTGDGHTGYASNRDYQLQQQQQQQSRRVALVPEAAAVREVALMNLTGLTGLPYHLLHPYRRQVLAAVTAALDDDRRAVRKAAVVCRTSWTVS